MVSGVLEVPAAANAESRAGKYLTFALGEQGYAVQVLRVREIASMQQITAVPHTPGYVRGVVNLRGKVIPVIDLRLKFGLPEQKYTPRTSIVVVQIERGTTRMLVGIIVDKVLEVLAFQTADIEDTPDFGDGLATPYILGMAKAKGKMKILLDINMVLSAQQL
ncbi:MAG TPA: chemotaxis protein CheW [Bryobacteraceae bacterium]|nr:chemotaxis protein CheW [Bryobacteraceae bacterium]